MSKAWKPPSSRPIVIYFEFRSKPSLVTVIFMDPMPNKLFATKYCFLIPRDDTSFFFFFSFPFRFLLFYIIINFYKNNYYLSVMKIIFIFSCSGMFRNVPACCGMLRVPDFIDALDSRHWMSFHNLAWYVNSKLFCNCDHKIPEHFLNIFLTP